MVGNRIEQIIKELFNENIRQFSLKVGIPSGQVANYIGGRTSLPRIDVIEKIILSIDNINSDWLVTGRGEMLKKEQNQEQFKGEIERYLEKKIDEKEKRIEELLMELGGQIRENHLLHEQLINQKKEYSVSNMTEKEGSEVS
jgi:hypothetical protein